MLLLPLIVLLSGCYTKLVIPARYYGDYSDSTYYESERYEPPVYFRGHYFDDCRYCGSWDYYYYSPYWVTSPYWYGYPTYVPDTRPGSRKIEKQALPDRRTNPSTPQSVTQPQQSQTRQRIATDPVQTQQETESSTNDDNSNDNKTETKTIPTRR
jgi:hypothetical protein